MNPQELDFGPYSKDPAVRSYLEGKRFTSEGINFTGGQQKSLSQQEVDAFIQEVIKEVKEKLETKHRNHPAMGPKRDGTIKAEGKITPSFNLKSTGRKDWDESMLHDERFKKVVEMMSPDDFLKVTDADRYETDKEKVSRYIVSIKSDSVLPIPTLLWGQYKYDRMKKYGIDEFKSTFHDGGHRVQALKQLGVTKLPVLHIIDTEE